MASKVLLRQQLFGILLVILIILGVHLVSAPVSGAEPLPVIDPESKGMKAARGAITNLISLEQLYAAVTDGDNQGLLLDLTGITTLLDGTPIEPGKIYGTIYVGPYPLQAKYSDYDMKAFRKKSDIKGGKGCLDLAYLLKTPHNSEGWTDTGVVALRVDLACETPGQDRRLGVYDTFVRFKKAGNIFTKQPTIVEGPLSTWSAAMTGAAWSSPLKPGKRWQAKWLWRMAGNFRILPPRGGTRSSSRGSNRPRNTATG